MKKSQMQPCVAPRMIGGWIVMDGRFAKIPSGFIMFAGGGKKRSTHQLTSAALGPTRTAWLCAFSHDATRCRPAGSPVCTESKNGFRARDWCTTTSDRVVPTSGRRLEHSSLWVYRIVTIYARRRKKKVVTTNQLQLKTKARLYFVVLL